jgi:hypothetical protein
MAFLDVHGGKHYHRNECKRGHSSLRIYRSFLKALIVHLGQVCVLLWYRFDGPRQEWGRLTKGANRRLPLWPVFSPSLRTHTTKCKEKGIIQNDTNSRTIIFTSLHHMILKDSTAVHMHNPKKIKRKHGSVFVSESESEETWYFCQKHRRDYVVARPTGFALSRTPGNALLVPAIKFLPRPEKLECVIRGTLCTSTSTDANKIEWNQHLFLALCYSRVVSTLKLITVMWVI